MKRDGRTGQRGQHNQGGVRVFSFDAAQQYVADRVSVVFATRERRLVYIRDVIIAFFSAHVAHIMISTRQYQCIFDRCWHGYQEGRKDGMTEAAQAGRGLAFLLSFDAAQWAE